MKKSLSNAPIYNSNISSKNLNSIIKEIDFLINQEKNKKILEKLKI